MRFPTRRIACALVVAAAVSLAAPPSGSPVAAGEASAQKAAKGGGGQAERVGENAADLASEILVPILVVAIGAIALVALMRREVGMAISVALIGLIAGWFLMAPDSVERVFRGVYERIT